MKKKNLQVSELFVLTLILAVVGGFLDAYTYTLRGEVFANAQTGNVVKLALNLASGNFSLASHYLLPIFSFAVGILITCFIRKFFLKRSLNSTLHWRGITIIIEISVLFVVSFIVSSDYNNVVNAAISFVCAVQVESFRKFEGNPFASTMCTGNLRFASEKLFCAISEGNASELKTSMKYYSIILFFVFGVIFGRYMSVFIGVSSVRICCVILLAVFLLMLKYDKDSMDK